MSGERNPEADSSRSVNPLSDAPIPQELIQDIPEEVRDKLIQYISEIVHIEHFSGPLPPPGKLSEYNDVMPGSAEIIVNTAVEHQKHRMSLEERVLEATIQEERRGMWLGFILAVSMIVCGTLIILSGASVEGLALIAADVVAIALVYVHDHRDRHS